MADDLFSSFRPGPIINPGYAFTTGLHDYLTQRELMEMKREEQKLAVEREHRMQQSMLEEMQLRREESLNSRQEREQRRLDAAENAKREQAKLILDQRKEASTRYGKFYQPGDFALPEHIEENNALGGGLLPGETIAPQPPPAVGPGPGQMATTPEDPSIQFTGPLQRGGLRLMGTAEQRDDQTRREKIAEVSQRLSTLDPGSPEYRKAILDYQMVSEKPIPAGLLGAGTQGVYRQNPRTGVVEKVGDVPQGSHFMTQPNEPPQIDLSERGLDMAAVMYAKTGLLPPMGMGSAAADVRARIIDRASQYDEKAGGFAAASGPAPTGPPPDIAANKAGYVSDTAALTQLTKNKEAVDAFAATARANTVPMRALLNKIPDTGTTVGNMLLRPVATAAGSENMARFTVLRQSLQTEYARLIQNPNLVGVLSDRARKEIEAGLSPDATVPQLKAALDTLELESQNRSAGLNQQIQSIRERIKSPTTPPTAPPAEPAAGTPPLKLGRFEVVTRP